MMKLCIVVLDQDTAEVPVTIKNKSINVGLIHEWLAIISMMN